MENPMKMDDLGVSLFLETPKSSRSPHFQSLSCVASGVAAGASAAYKCPTTKADAMILRIFFRRKEPKAIEVCFRSCFGFQLG